MSKLRLLTDEPKLSHKASYFPGDRKGIHQIVPFFQFFMVFLSVFYVLLYGQTLADAVFSLTATVWSNLLVAFKTNSLFGRSIGRKAKVKISTYALVITFLVFYQLYFFGSMRLIWAQSVAICEDENWIYRKAHNITGSSTAQTNYQMNITVYNTTGTDAGSAVYISDKARSDFGDIRFTNSTGNELDYWIEEFGSNYAKFWVEVPTIPPSPGTETIYIYYGNSTATTTSNGTNTFVYFYDMSSSTGLTTNAATFSGGEATLDPTGAQPAAYVRMDTATYDLTNMALMVRANWYSEYGSWKEQGIQWATDTGANANQYNNVPNSDSIIIHTIWNDANNWRFSTRSGTSITDVSIPYTTVDPRGAYHVFELRQTGDNSGKLFLDDIERASSTTNIPTGAYNLQLGWYQYLGAGTQKIDWALIRKAVSPEPSHGSWGSEQSKDTNQTWCTDCVYTWFSDLGTWIGGNYQCCGDDTASDDFATHNGSLSTSTSVNCRRCLDGADQGTATLYGNGYLSGSGTSRTCYFWHQTCNADSASHGSSITVYGWGYYEGNLETSTTVDCRSAAATCALGDAGNASATTLCGNGYFSSSTSSCSGADKTTATSGYCYYGDMTCASGSGANGAVSAVLYGNGKWSGTSTTTDTSGTCYYGDIVCSDGSSGHGTSGTYYGNGYNSSTTCYYGDITCSDGNAANGTSCVLTDANDACADDVACIKRLTTENAKKPTDPSTYASGASYQFNVTVNDIDGTEYINVTLFEFNASGAVLGNTSVTTYRTINGTAREYYISKTDLWAGTYSWKWYANDSSNVWGTTQSGTFTVSKAPPTMTLKLDGSSATPQTRTYPNTTAISLTETNSVDSGCSYDIKENGTSQGSTTYQKQLAGRSYNITGYTTGCTNYTAGQTEIMLTVNKAASSVSISLTNNNTAYGTTQGASCSLTTGDTDTSLTLTRNITLFAQTAISPSESTVLSAGQHNYTCTYPSTQNYSASYQTKWLYVTKATPSLSLTLNGTAGDKTYTYPEAIGASASESNTGDSGCTYTLWRDGVSKGTGSSVSENILLGNATYVYKYNTTGCTNYTSTTIQRTAYVNKGYLALSISASPSWAVTYPTQTAVTGAESNVGDADVTYQLWRDTTMVSNAAPWQDVQTLNQGSYTYRFNATEGSNWTANATGVSNTLTVSQNSTNPVDIYFRNSTGEYKNQNMMVTYGTQTNATGVAVYGSSAGTVYVYKDGTQKASGSGAASEGYVTLGSGTYTYKVNITGNSNYASNATGVSFTITVNKGTISSYLDVLLDGTKADKAVTYPTTVTPGGVFNSTGATDITFKLYRNDEDSTSENNTAITYGAGTHQFKYGMASGTYANWTAGNSSVRTLTVNPTSATLALYLNGSSSNITVERNWVVNITAAANNAQGTIYLYNNTVLITSCTSQSTCSNIESHPANVGTEFNITVHYPATQNYSAATSTTYWIKINNTKPSVPSLVTPIDNDYTADNTTTFDWSSSDPNTEQSITYDMKIFYNNGTLRQQNTTLASSTLTLSTSEALPDGIYKWSVRAYDTMDYSAWASNNTLTIDTINPDITMYVPSPLNTTIVNGSIALNISCFNTNLEDVKLNITNSTNTLMHSNSTSALSQATYWWTHTVNTSAWNEGNMTITVDCLDKADNRRVESYTFTVDHYIPSIPTFGLTTYPTSPTTYEKDKSYQFNATVTDSATPVSQVIFEFNGVNYTDASKDGNVYYRTLTDLAANEAGYSYKWYANDSANNWNASSTETYMINKASPNTGMVLMLDGSSTTLQTRTYPNATDVQSSEINVGDSGCTYTLYQDGQIISNGVVTLAARPADDYNFTYATTGCANYTSGQREKGLTVNRGDVSIDIWLNGNPNSDKTIAYPTQANATCKINIMSQNGFTLLQNGTSKGTQSGQVIEYVETLPVQSFNFTCSFSQTENYSAFTRTNYLTITKGTTLTHLFLNGTEGNKEYIRTEVANITATSNLPSLTVKIYANYSGDLKEIASGTGLAQNDTDTGNLDLKIYSIKANSTENENYTSSQVEYALTVVDRTNINPVLVNTSTPIRGKGLGVEAKLSYANTSVVLNQNLSFTDETTGLSMGTDFTNTSGYAEVNYAVPSTSTLGPHIINVTYASNGTAFTRGTHNDSVSVNVYSKANITFITTSTTINSTASIALVARVLDSINGSGIQNYPCNFYDNDTVTLGNNILTNATGYCNYTWDTTGFAGGLRTVRVNISTNATLYYFGDAPYDNDTISITINALPQVGTPVFNVTEVEKGDGIQINCTVTDAENSSSNLVVNISILKPDDTWTNETVGFSGSTFFRNYSTDWPLGNYIVICSAVDSLGGYNESASATFLIWQNGTVSMTLNVTEVWWEDPINISGRAMYIDGVNPLVNDNVTVKVGGVIRCTTTTDAIGNYECSFTAPSRIGKYTVRVDVLDVTTLKTITNTTSLVVRIRYGGTEMERRRARAVGCYEEPLIIQNPDGTKSTIMTRVCVWK